MSELKEQVHDFWNRASCGEELYLRSHDAAGFAEQARKRYQLEPYIPGFAKFDQCAGRRVLEIGVGLGADHECFARAGAVLSGIDLTERAVANVSERFKVLGLHSDLQVADAEKLPFADSTFDVVYSWGVIHHSPDTPAAVRQIHRVLKPGGVARIMVYNYWSMIGLMLWLRYGALRLKPWTSLADMYSQYLESPGTKAYTPRQAHDLFKDFEQVHVDTVLTHGDLLESEAGQRHRGAALDIARKVWPRWAIKRLAPKAGLFMLIEAVKGRA